MGQKTRQARRLPSFLHYYFLFRHFVSCIYDYVRDNPTDRNSKHEGAALISRNPVNQQVSIQKEGKNQIHKHPIRQRVFFASVISKHNIQDIVNNYDSE